MPVLTSWPFLLALAALIVNDAWLKGAAIRYDLDHSEARGLAQPFKQSISSRHEYYGAVLEYNLAVAALFKSVGWTLSDYLGSLKTEPAPPEEPHSQESRSQESQKAQESPEEPAP